jgi:hypothetical protein
MLGVDGGAAPQDVDLVHVECQLVAVPENNGPSSSRLIFSTPFPSKMHRLEQDAFFSVLIKRYRLVGWSILLSSSV